MGATSSMGIISVIYKFRLKNLAYKIYTTIPKSHMQTTLDAIVDEKQSADIKNNNITHIFHHLTCN